MKSSLLREQPGHTDFPPAEQVRPGGALPARYGETLEVSGHGSGGLPQRQPLPQCCPCCRCHTGYVLLPAGAHGKNSCLDICRWFNLSSFSFPSFLNMLSTAPKQTISKRSIWPYSPLYNLFVLFFVFVSAACKVSDLLWHPPGPPSSCHTWPGSSWGQPAFPH